MAKIQAFGFDEVYRSLQKQKKKTPELMKKMVEAGADPYKQATEYHIAQADLIESGAMYASIKKGTPRFKNDGVEIEVYPQGIRGAETPSPGERNETVAFVQQNKFGETFMEKAAADAQEKAVDAMMNVLERESES